MANQEHLDILKQGVEMWNQWRKEHADITPDLHGVGLHGVDLHGVGLRGANLQSNNVRCWFAPEDLKPGELVRSGIDEAIRLHDKLLLILSKHSVKSGWVEREVKTTLMRERKEKQTILFPVHIDKAVLGSPLSWATRIRQERYIAYFTRWKNHDDYQKAFRRLLRDLKASSQP